MLKLKILSIFINIRDMNIYTVIKNNFETHIFTNIMVMNIIRVIHVILISNRVERICI